MDYLFLESQAVLYCARNGLAIQKRLGEGTDGAVWRTQATAVKISASRVNYERERDCYLRLQSHAVFSLHGFQIPRFVNADDELLAVEMGIVQPPFILDFGKAYLDTPPEYSLDEIIMEEWREAQVELWEEDWPRIRRLVAALKQYGIYYYDLSRNNIQFK